MRIAVLGIDLGKNGCGLVGLDEGGRVVPRRRPRREDVAAFAAGLPPRVAAMEACCGARHLGRLLATQGRAVRLASPEYVRPHVEARGNDDRDAEAIAEAATRPTMRSVAPKAEARPDTRTLHRVRDRPVAERAPLTDQPRAVPLERGIAVAQGRRKLAGRPAELLAGEPPPSARIVGLLRDPAERWRDLDRRVAGLDDEFAATARRGEAARRLAAVPGIGAPTATALAAAVGDARTFARGRDLAARLGLVPRQATTGGRPRLLGTAGRGSERPRKLLIQGARAAMPRLARSDTRLGGWLRGLLARAHPNAAVVAPAAGLARTAWAMLRRGRGRVREPAPAAAAG